MATFSRTLSGDSRYSITLTVTESIPSDYISTNKTNVSYTLTATKSSGSGYWDNVVQNPVRVVINGSTVVNKTIAYDFTGSTPKTITLASGTVTGISHNADGSKTIAVSGYFQDIDNGLGSATASGNLTLTKIPRQANLSTAQDFNDEGNPTITYTNSAGSAVTTLQARIENTAGTVAYADYRDVNKTGTLSYTFNLTTEERSALRNATPNSNTMSVRFNLKTVIGGNTYNSTITKTMTIVNGNPTFSNFTFEDTNSTTLALTGNNQYCILNYSSIKAIISNANKAIANKDANMTDNGAKYQFVCGNITKDIAYSSTDDVNGTIDNVTSGTFTVYAIDSRGNSTPIQKTASSIINYSNIYLNPSNSYLERDNSGVGGNVTLHYTGTFWNDNFGDVANSITSVTYEYKKTSDSNYTTGTTSITPTISGNNISFDGSIAGPGAGYIFEVDSAYNVRITISDELSSYTLNLILNSGTPNLAYADDGVSVMGDYDDTLDSGLQVTGKLYLNKNEIDTSNKVLDIYNNTSGSSRKDLLENKLTVGRDNSTKANEIIMINGGWSGINYGYGIYSKIANDVDHFLYVDQNGIYTIREYNNNYEYNFMSGKYSTSEVICGTWIDGKTLYRRTINKTTTSGTLSYVAKSEISSDLERVVRFEGMMIQPSGNIANLPYYTASDDKCDVWWRNIESRVVIRPGTTAGYGNTYLTIYYTKTTD